MRGAPHAAAYERFTQGCPRRPPAASRAESESRQITQGEYQEALQRSKKIERPNTHRDYELRDALHDVLTAHHDRGFGDLNSPLGIIFAKSNISLVAIGIDATTSKPSHRALVFSNNCDAINLDKPLILGVWHNRTRFLPPSAEITPSAWPTIGPVVHKSRTGGESSHNGEENRTTYELLPCRICAKRARVPSGLGVSTAAGPIWWTDWNPSTHSTPNPLDSDHIFPWGAQDVYSGQSVKPQWLPLDTDAARDFGQDSMPDCSHMWRTRGPWTSGAVEYARNPNNTFTSSELRSLAIQGGKLIRENMGMRPVLMALQELEFREMAHKSNSPTGIANYVLPNTPLWSEYWIMVDKHTMYAVSEKYRELGGGGPPHITPTTRNSRF